MILSEISSNLVSKKTVQCVCLCILFSVAINMIGHSYPENFEQPLKYRLLCFGAEFLNVFGHALEYFDIGHRLIMTRIAYHWTVGAMNIRDPNHFIEIIDEDVEHCSMRIFRSMNRTGKVMPTIIFYHGGGHFVGSADIFEPVTYLLAKDTTFQVIYVEFRLIPEYKFPAPLTDSLLVTKHLLKYSNKYKIDMQNLVLMGDSAGGNLATVIGQQLINEKIARPKLQVLVYPILQFYDFTLPSYRINMEKRVLGSIHHENFKNFLLHLTGYPVDDSIFYNGHTTGMHKDSLYNKYVNVDLLPPKLRNHNLRDVPLRNDTSGKYSKLTEIVLNKNLSPLLVSDEELLKNTPINTFLITVELDPLRDDGFIYAERLRRIGLNVKHKHYTDVFHGILNLIYGPLEFQKASDLLDDISSAIKEVIN